MLSIPKRLREIGIALLCLASVMAAQVRVEDIKTFQLENGMKVMIVQDHSIPNVIYFTFFKVGSRNEYPGITGLSHFFEHMMFNGAKKYGPGEFDRVMENNGGSNNAFTSEDMTAYFNTFPTQAMELIFELEADRLGNLALDDKMVESERGVVLSERITGFENSNYELLSEQLTGVAFHAHPYGWSVIGHESDIKNWKKSDLQNYFETYYAPNNAVLIVCGDVEEEAVRKLARQYLEPIPARTPPRKVHTVEPPQMGEKRLTVNRKTASPHILMAYHVPEARHPDFHALDLLNAILSSGKSSRLYMSLVDKKQLALEIQSVNPSQMDPGLFTIYAVCAEGSPVDKLENAIYEELQNISRDGVTEKELQKVKNLKLITFYRQMETLTGKAQSLGFYELVFGGYEKLFSAPEAYNKVSLEDIKRVAAAYFKKTNRTVGILETGEEK